LYNTAITVWITLALIYILINVATLLSSNIRLSMVLCISCIALEILSNEIIVYLCGTVASHALIFIVISVSVYRVFFDYRQGLFAAGFGIGIHFLDVLLVLTGVIPQVSVLYAAPGKAELEQYAILTVVTVIIGVLIAFSTINLGMNRYYRLRKILSENWKSDLVFLEQFSEQVSACSDEPSLYAQAAKAVAYIAPFCQSAIILLEDGKAAVQAASGWQDEALSHALRVLLKTGLPEEEMSFTVDTPNKTTVLCLSFECGTGSEAYMLVGTDDPQTPNEHRKKMLQNIAEISGNALSACRRLNQERSVARVDELTGVYNKRYFLEEWPGWLKRALEERTPLAVAIFDIDNFKSYNDTFGHLNGDKLLTRVAQTIRMQLRDRDAVARFGGEEFVVMFDKADLQMGFRIAERIRNAVQELQGGEILRTVTISGGIAALPDDPKDPDALLECADQRLYQAKRSGRNQICPVVNKGSFQ